MKNGKYFIIYKHTYQLRLLVLQDHRKRGFQTSKQESLASVVNLTKYLLAVKKKAPVSGAFFNLKI